MAYIKQVWKNDPPSQETPISAERLNHMETQYDEAVTFAETRVRSDNSTIDNVEWYASESALPTVGISGTIYFIDA